MFDFFKKKPPAWLDEWGCKCQNCGADFNAYKEFLSFGAEETLIRRLDLDPPLINGKPDNRSEALCRLVIICILCFRDYVRGQPKEADPRLTVNQFDEKMINLCQSIHNEQGIIIPNGLYRDENGFFIQPPGRYIIPSMSGEIVPDSPKFEFITNENICLENAKNLTISKKSFSHLLSPKVKKVRAEYNSSKKIKLNEEKLKKLGSGIHRVTLANGVKYIGELKDGKPHGQGTSSTISSSIGIGTYTGEFQDGKPHGEGTLFLPEDIARKLGIDRWEGRFINGEFQGDVLTGKAYRDE